MLNLEPQIFPAFHVRVVMISTNVIVMIIVIIIVVIIIISSSSSSSIMIELTIIEITS